MENWKVVKFDPKGRAFLRDVVNKQLKKKYKRIGSGLYADVYDMGNKVVKVVGAHDAGYLMYMRLIMSGVYDSPYLPKIYKVIHLQYKTTDKFRSYEGADGRGHSFNECFLVYMEKLTSVECEEWDQKPCRAGRVSDRMKYMLSEMVYYGNPIPKVSKKHQDLFEFLRMAWAASGEHGTVDLHRGNVMLRGSQLVVTDPLCGAGKYFERNTIYDPISIS